MHHLSKVINISTLLYVDAREIAFKKFSDNKMIMKYLEQGQ
jgi:hypothetical protein